jgi:ABC-type transport system involved in multi-copper enzyme maturation permease subunit
VQFIKIDADFFRGFVLYQGFFLMMACIWPGALLIARDLKTNAIQLYLSKPLSRLDYVVGKLAVVAAMGGILMTAPALILFLMELGLSTTSTFIVTYWWLPLAIVGYSAVVILAAGVVVLAASSLSRSGAYAGLLFFGLIFFSQVASGLLMLITRNDAFLVISVQQLTEQIASLFFGGSLEFGKHPVAAALFYAALVGVSAVILRRRVKAVEIVT